MKKVLFFLLLFLPIFVKADYEITDYRMNITILENGDLNIIEVFSLDGEYNGFKRIVNNKGNFDGYRGEFIKSCDVTYDGDEVILNEVRAINFSLETPFLELKENGDLFKKDNKAQKGDYGLYSIKETDNGSIFTIYNADKMNKDFYLDYTIKNVVIKHEDVSEILLELFNDSKEIINNLEININIPNNKETLKIWTHDMNGETEIIDSETIKIISTNVETKNKPYFRLVFDNIIDGKKNDEIILDKIIEIESKEIPVYEDKEYIELQKKAYDSVVKVEKTKSKVDYEDALNIVNTLDSKDELQIQLLLKLLSIEPLIERIYIFKKVSLTSIMGIWLIGLITIIYQMYKKFSFNQKYDNKEYSKALIGYLMNRKVTSNDLIVVILELMKKKVIIKDNNILKTTSNNLTEIEQRAIKFLFNDSNKIEIDKVKENCSKNYNHFLASYSNFTNSLIKRIDENDFFEDTLFFKILGFLYAIFGLILGILLINHDTYFSSYIIIIISLLFSIFFLLFYKKTKKGLNEYKKYKLLKKEIINDEINLENIQDELIYLVCFGYNDFSIVKNKLFQLNKKDFKIVKNSIDEYSVVIDLIHYLIKTSLKTKKSM